MQKFTFNSPKITKAAVIFPDVYSQHNSLDSQYRLQEACGLAYAINLEVVYHRARQTAITLELTDIIGGANAANGGN